VGALRCGSSKNALAALALGVTCLATAASGEPLAPTRPPPADCLTYMPRYGPNAGLLDWRDTVAVEHCDRIKRLWSLASRTYYGTPPQFFDGYVSAAQLPTDISISLPLLRVVFPERVFFDTARSELRPEAMEVVRVIAANLRMEPPDVVLFVAGHTDARGGRAYNQGLYVDRANAVADAILLEGVNVARVWRVGFGEDMPLRAGDDESAWGENRRVEFLFAARSEAVAVWLEDAQIDMLCQGRTAAEVDDCVNRLDLDTSYVAIETSQADLNLRAEGGGLFINPSGTNRYTINPTNRRPRQREGNQ
jgi:outer membrane protein OmpA-like peptidoglycan-associated protein